MRYLDCQAVCNLEIVAPWLIAELQCNWCVCLPRRVFGCLPLVLHLASRARCVQLEAEEDIYTVITAYFKEKGLVRQQLDSFDEFIQNTMQEVVEQSHPIELYPEPAGGDDNKVFPCRATAIVSCQLSPLCMRSAPRSRSSLARFT